MQTPAPAVLTIVAVGAFLLTTVDALRAAPRPAIPRTPEATKYADGAPPGFSGGFGESACDACHFEAAVNTPPGSVTLTGIPDRFVPGLIL